jgi:putative transposase
VRFAAIAGWADSGSYPVSFMCAWLGVSRSGYYAWRGAEPSQRSQDDSALIAVMKKVYKEARGNPGVRRMRAGLAALHRLNS